MQLQSTQSIALTRMQSFLLQGLLPIVVVAVGLPIGLVALFLSLKHASVSDAVSHGELYLAGGNAAFVGCVSLIASRQDQGLNSAIAALFTVAIVVLPCYGSWAYLAVAALLSEPYSQEYAVEGGVVVALCGMIVGITFVLLSYRPGTE